MKNPTTAPAAHCVRCSIPGYRCIEEETRIRSGSAARHIAQRKTGQAIARAMSPERMNARWTIAIGSAR